MGDLWRARSCTRFLYVQHKSCWFEIKVIDPITECDRNACRVSLTCGWGKMAVGTRHFYKLKIRSRFPNVAAYNAWTWATTHNGFFLGKNCSWTLLPGSIWLETPITWLYLCWKFQSMLYFLELVDYLLVYQSFIMTLNHQVGVQGTCP